jgi:outer membrane lipoprotein
MWASHRTVDPIRSGLPSLRRASGLLAGLVLVGCASQIPEAIRTLPQAPVELTQVQQEPTRYLGRSVRWGGRILAVDNRPDSTEIEILSRPLDGTGAPRPQGKAQGRFIAQVAGFLDPAEYRKDRELTVRGVVTGVETRAVGDYPYRYPIVRADSRYLWPEAPPSGPYPLGYPPGPGPWRGPWYDPWVWPYGPWPWRSPGYY